MKKVIIALAVICILGMFSQQATAECYSGGPGSTSCSYTESFLNLYTITHSVSCGSGYYACCSDTGASCIKESTSGGTPKPNVIKE